MKVVRKPEVIEARRFEGSSDLAAMVEWLYDRNFIATYWPPIKGEAGHLRIEINSEGLRWLAVPSGSWVVLDFEESLGILIQTDIAFGCKYTEYEE
jgi:hypothetical protein